MRPEERDAALLWDMLPASEECMLFVAERSFEEYAADPILRAAVERKIQIAGEAARRVSPAFRKAHAEVPWRAIQTQRHVQVHDYGDIIDEKIWDVATRHIPALGQQRRVLIPEPPPDPDLDSATPGGD
jgi:uncharacterized protein with HEPN domain